MHLFPLQHVVFCCVFLMYDGSHVLLSLQREELTEVILKLLLAWRDPLWHFHNSMAHHHDFNNFSSNKALEMSDMVHELRKGVEKVAEKVQYVSILYYCMNANMKRCRSLHEQLQYLL